MKPVLRRRWLVLLVIVTIVVRLPALRVVASSATADLPGCALDEGSAHACLL